MAVQIQQQPAEFNLAVGPNVWVLKDISPAANRYALRIWRQVTSSTVEIVGEYKQAPNPAGYGIFDLSEVLQSYLRRYEEEAIVQQTWYIYNQRKEQFSTMRYYIEYGEQIGDADPDYQETPSSAKTVFNGYKPFYDLDWPNFGQYIVEMEETPCEGPGQSAYSSCTIYEGKFLTSYPQTRDYSDVSNVPERNVYTDTWMTLSYAAFHQSSWTSLDNFNKEPWGYKIEYYNAAGSVYDTRYYTLKLGGCFTDSPWVWDPSGLIKYIGVGPANLKAAGSWPTVDPNHYRITLFTKNCNLGTDCTDIVDISESEGCVWYQESFTLLEDCSKFEPIQFSFMNEFGVLDYYTFTKRNTYTEQTQRNNWFRDAGSWSGSVFSIRPGERGTKTFNSTATGSMLVSTDWVTNEEAQWLEKLYTSPFTNAYIDGKWIAVNITSNTYEEKSVARNNKLFRYELTFEYSQPQQRQRG